MESFVLVRGIIAVIKYYGQKEVGEERVHLVYTFSLLYITKGSQDRNISRIETWSKEQMQKPWRRCN